MTATQRSAHAQVTADIPRAPWIHSRVRITDPARLEKAFGITESNLPESQWSPRGCIPSRSLGASISLLRSFQKQLSFAVARVEGDRASGCSTGLSQGISHVLSHRKATQESRSQLLQPGLCFPAEQSPSRTASCPSPAGLAGQRGARAAALLQEECRKPAPAQPAAAAPRVKVTNHFPPQGCSCLAAQDGAHSACTLPALPL